MGVGSGAVGDRSRGITSNADNQNGFLASGAVTVEQIRAGTPLTEGIVRVNIDQSIVRQQRITFEIPKAEAEALQSQETRLIATLTDFSPLPSWLTFNSDGAFFTATNIPANGLPIKALLRAGKRQVIVEIMEM